MLVSFHESYLLLVEICALFCILVMFYNLCEYLTRDIRRKKQDRKIETIKELLNLYGNSQDKERRKCYKKLSVILNNSKGLLALTTALNEIGWDESSKMTPITRRALCELLTEKYIHVYKKEDESVQGMLISLFTRCDASSSRLKRILLENLEAKNLLVRMETMRCISAQKNRKLMILALKSISCQPQYFSNKLLTDTLIEFKGNRKALMEELWEKHTTYSSNIQISIIQMMTVLQEESFAEQIYGVVENRETDKEIRIAALKFFQSVLRPEYVNTFAEFLVNPVWEYGAVAANVLRSYDCTGIFEQLLNGCSSRNWYIRNNCAKTIVECCSEEQIEQAMQVNDRYSKESIRYIWKTMEKEGVA